MASISMQIAKRLWPEVTTLPDEVQTNGIANVLTVLYAAPLAALGLVWLALSTDLSLFLREWRMFVLLAGLMFLLERISFFVTIETGRGRYANSEGSLDTVILWAGVLLFGPTAIWIMVIGSFIEHLMVISRTNSKGERWNAARNLTVGIACLSLGILIAIEIYQVLGGVIPLAGLDVTAIIPAIAALIIYFMINLLIWSGFILYILFNRQSLISDMSRTPILRLILMAIAIPNLVTPISIIIAGLYVQHGILLFLFMVVGVILVAILARRLSLEAEDNRQRARQLEKLERLGEAIIGAPFDASSLPSLLEETVPAMFPGRVIIWVLDDQILLRYPPEWDVDIEMVNGWIKGQTRPFGITQRSNLPWDQTQKALRPIVIAPIYDNGNDENIGGIFVELRPFVQPMSLRNLENLFPAALSLSSLIASTLHQAERYAQTLEYQKITQELTLAGRIQASFLPSRMPDLPGWQLAVALLPARATSGDFFDFIPLSNGRLGIVIADVVDKGIGPALYMALSRTLIRTFAVQYEDRPDLVLAATNRRILSDARANLFVTIFYAVLDPVTGMFTYCNAGHNPPMLISLEGEGGLTNLDKTGIPIGIDEEAAWEFHTCQVYPGDVLVMFTDGVTEAQNEDDEFFDEDLLVDATLSNFGRPAHEIQVGILEALQNFVGDTPQVDDITLMVLARDRVDERQQVPDISHEAELKQLPAVNWGRGRGWGIFST
jgi:serine phosphatase RsbU (regulator of sigma subunit)